MRAGDLDHRQEARVDLRVAASETRTGGALKILPAPSGFVTSLPKGSNVVPFWVVFYSP